MSQKCAVSNGRVAYGVQQFELRDRDRRKQLEVRQVEASLHNLYFSFQTVTTNYGQFLLWFIEFRSRKQRSAAVGIRCAGHATVSTRKFGTNFADMRRSSDGVVRRTEATASFVSNGFLDSLLTTVWMIMNDAETSSSNLF
jgi:hypothetical protein